jgi:hypothetical protein
LKHLYTTGNRVFTESWKLRREPNLMLSVNLLFTESKCFGSRRKDWPTVNRTFAESFLLSALGEGFG